jgi:hypothetical protein
LEAGSNFGRLEKFLIFLSDLRCQSDYRMKCAQGGTLAPGKNQHCAGAAHLLTGPQGSTPGKSLPVAISAEDGQ